MSRSPVRLRQLRMTVAAIAAAGGLLMPSCEQKIEKGTATRQVTAGPAIEPTTAEAQHIVYVPAYAHLAHGRGDERTMLAITLSVRNVGPQNDLTLEYVDYYDTPGRVVRRYIDEPRTLGPLETAEFTVTARDDTGGSGANFLLGWSGSSRPSDLLAEAVMVGHTGDGYLSFTSRGVPLRGQPSAELRGLPPEFEPANLVPTGTNPNDTTEASPATTAAPGRDQPTAGKPAR